MVIEQYPETMGAKSGPNTVVFGNCQRSVSYGMTDEKDKGDKTKETNRHEEAHGPPSCIGVTVQIGQDARDDGDGRTGKDGHEEAENDEGGVVGRQGTSQGPESENHEGDKCDDAASKVFAEGSPDDGPKDVA